MSCKLDDTFVNDFDIHLTWSFVMIWPQNHPKPLEDSWNHQGAEAVLRISIPMHKAYLGGGPKFQPRGQVGLFLVGWLEPGAQISLPWSKFSTECLVPEKWGGLEGLILSNWGPGNFSAAIAVILWGGTLFSGERV